MILTVGLTVSLFAMSVDHQDTVAAANAVSQKLKEDNKSIGTGAESPLCMTEQAFLIQEEW